MERFEVVRIIGRETELDTIRGFFHSRIESRSGGGLYICGRSGTGKTEAVRQVYDGVQKSLLAHERAGKQSKRARKSRDEVVLAWLNGNTLATRETVMSSLALALSVSASTGTQLESSVEARLSRQPDESEALVFVVIDEVDLLPPELVRRLFSWAHDKSSLALIGIANVVNVGANLFKTVLIPPKEIAFVPYDATQLKAIAALKLGERADLFSPEALDMCARKISVKSGDVRQCLSLCEQALSLAKDKPKVALIDVVKAAGTTQTPIARTISALPAQCKFALVACVNAANARTNTSSSMTDTASPRLERYPDPVSFTDVQEHWQKLREHWSIPIDGDVEDHLYGLCSSKVLEIVTIPKTKPVKNASSKKAATTSGSAYKILANRDEVLNGLTGGDEVDEDDSNDTQGNYEKDVIARRPIIMAFNGVRRRSYVNMHAATLSS